MEACSAHSTSYYQNSAAPLEPLSAVLLQSMCCVPYFKVRGTYNWLHNCSYTPLIRPLSRISQLLTGLEVENLIISTQDLQLSTSRIQQRFASLLNSKTCTSANPGQTTEALFKTGRYAYYMLYSIYHMLYEIFYSRSVYDMLYTIYHIPQICVYMDDIPYIYICIYTCTLYVRLYPLSKTAAKCPRTWPGRRASRFELPAGRSHHC